jgi:hypothetical protein
MDLLVTAVLSPVDFPNRMISIRETNNREKIQMVLKKSEKKFTESFRDEAYWSNFGCNSMPFNLTLPKKESDTFYCAFEFAEEIMVHYPALHRKTSSYRDSLKPANE